MAMCGRTAHALRVLRLAGVLSSMTTLCFCGVSDMYANVFFLHHSDITKLPVHVIKSVR
ncbi:hypothetical protein DPMN_022952 [Dreissena polymorpha]|uniref:Uncharacterized protein n=1 Tax=Dreissena polymorpha TaxID=45954 RepID=A0A9D4LLG3_DREPO|nr:hypothetical protein DPMN_022952 [Dreissena polymorpha]